MSTVARLFLLLFCPAENLSTEPVDKVVRNLCGMVLSRVADWRICDRPTIALFENINKNKYLSKFNECQP